MTSAIVRQKFLDFFESKGHKIVPSAPLVLKNDPSLLFTNSGMVQFKDYFLGNSISTNRRVADTQKCLRVSGKHNDLEDVGLDTYHHTMFEMLGNWSFGDYFKKEAISWAWELLTGVYELPKDRLYVTVFGGDKGDNLQVDEEAKDLWRTFVQEDRILHGNKKDNFWEMGESGPCGPCSEIHIDLRSEEERMLKAGRDLVNSDHPQVVEIWNLVFIQFNRLASGALVPLPDKHVDTGMGFERLCMAIQAKTSNYDTDVFSPLMDFIAINANVKYGDNIKTDIAIRVMADHIRAVSFAISDGQLPSNTGAGYVIRRILRRAVRYGFSYLNFKEPFIHRLVPLLALQLKDVFPELHQQLEYVSKVVHEEEISFLRTLEKGLKRIENFDKTISGEQAFELYDTFGFPFDLTSLIARERGFLVDEKGFIEEMAKQKTRSKADAAKETGDWVVVLEGDLPAGQAGKPEFIGYDELTSTSKILRYRKVKQKNKELFQLVLDKTPFYAESGGQVGDTGTLEIELEKITVVDTKKENDLIVHWVERLPANLEGIVQAKVNVHQRRLSMANHSATHLLHAALREVLGKHVEQKGSLVNDKILRFDFSHFAAMTSEEVSRVETIVNEKIRENIQLNEQRNVPIEKAKSLGAMALFGEKYGEFVRVITFDPKFSVELCGGTHVKATGNIGLLKIVSESSVAAGVRRIEAVTADGAFEYLNGFYNEMGQIKAQLKNPKDVVASIQALVDEKHGLEKKLEIIYQQQANTLKDILAAKAVKSNGCTLVLERVSVPNADALKNIAYALRNQFDDLLMILAADMEGKPQVAVMIGEKLEATKKYHAGNMVKELARGIDGGGGGQPFFATAGGKDISGLDRVIEKAIKLVQV
ncbi:MAG: alanine--tRNA ligase [Cytophagales bacterium]|nr:alanine--tRNA ligase [Cytophagales bacterium]MCA6389557.1 alanine--tRNA ligase [Cytophagales bacterium]MCA6392681.1 alanine--tRNA ligase [Cytophagales bacterium]MCA6394486.1 alanine--tRNA ligase [Cytophagales bacterium]MCA6397487.1 alanine--tRNA ligase [Cytophagales bacterium]